MKMPAQMKEDWVKALESGKYYQGYGRLQDCEGGYCCLGVLQQMVSGELEMENERQTRTEPSLDWYRQHGIEVTLAAHSDKYINDTQMSTLMGMNDGKDTGDYNDDGDALWSGDKTFPEIAAWIRENIETL